MPVTPGSDTVSDAAEELRRLLEQGGFRVYNLECVEDMVEVYETAAAPVNMFRAKPDAGRHRRAKRASALPHSGWNTGTDD